MSIAADVTSNVAAQTEDCGAFLLKGKGPCGREVDEALTNESCGKTAMFRWLVVERGAVSDYNVSLRVATNVSLVH